MRLKLAAFLASVMVFWLAAGLPAGAAAPQPVPAAGDVVARSEFLSRVIKETGLNLDGVYFIRAPQVGDVATDVAAGAPYAGDLIIAGHHGVVENGRPFRPGDPVLREEAATMSVRALRAKLGSLPPGDFSLEPADAVRISPDCAFDVRDACRLGLLAPGGDNQLRPREQLTRSDLAVLTAALRVAVKYNQDGITWSLSADGKRVALYWGEKPTGGYSVEVRSVKRDGGLLKVFYILDSPGPGEVVTQAITHPRASVDLPGDIGHFTAVLPVRADDPVKIIFTIGENSYSAGNGVEVMDAVPFLESGRVYVPLRYLARALGVPADNIRWSPSARTVTLISEGRAVTLAVCGSIMYVNDKPVKMDAVPLIRENRVYLPARFLAEALGCLVEWYPGRQAVVIQTTLPSTNL